MWCSTTGSPDKDDDDRWIMTLKKELPGDRDGKNVRLAFSPAQIEPESFADTTPAVVGAGTKIQGNQGAEGPSLVRWNDQWLLYWDSYGAGPLLAGHFARSEDLDRRDVRPEAAVRPSAPRQCVFGGPGPGGLAVEEAGVVVGRFG